jgi:hypothetical protein
MSSTILCFSLNTDQTPLCEAYLDYKTEDKITKSRGFFSKNTACYNPLFFDEIEQKIIQYKPDIVVFFTENDLESGSWFHSDFLIEKMKRIIDPKSQAAYKLLERDKYTGPDIYNKNDRKETAIRMSIFIKENDGTTIKVDTNKGFFSSDENKINCNANHVKGKVSYQENVRALVLYTQNQMGKIAFIGLQYNEDAPNDSRICIKELEDKFIKDKNVDHVFIMGDYANTYNKNANLEGGSKEKSLISYLNSGPYLSDFRRNTILDTYENGKYDKKQEPESDIKEYSEKHKSDFISNFDSTYQNNNFVGYHDRIFNKDIGSDTKKIQCLEYNIIKGFPIHKLPNNYHYGVLGIYQVK